MPTEAHHRRQSLPELDANNSPILRYCGSVSPSWSQDALCAHGSASTIGLLDKTVVRGGYGIFYDFYEGREIDDSADIYPYSVRNNSEPCFGYNHQQAGQPTFHALHHVGSVPGIDPFLPGGHRVREPSQPLRPVLDGIG